MSHKSARQTLKCSGILCIGSNLLGESVEISLTHFLFKTKNELKDKIDKFNIGIDKMYTAINKVREKDGLKPKKRPKKLNVDKVIQDLDTGKK